MSQTPTSQANVRYIPFPGNQDVLQVIGGATGQPIAWIDANGTAQGNLSIGQQGPQGVPGNTGAPGATGPQGPQGPAGPAGVTLKSNGTTNGSQTLLNLVQSGLSVSDDGSGNVTIGYVAPAVGNFTFINQGGASATQTVSGGPIFMLLPNTVAANWRGLFLAQPTTPYKVQILSRSIFGGNPTNSFTTGLYFYDGTKLMGIEALGQVAGWVTRIEKITNVTTDNSTAATIGSQGLNNTTTNAHSPAWYQLRNNGSTIFFDYSWDGVNFTNAFSEAIGTFITPTQIGWGGINVNSGGTVAHNLLIWRTFANATL